VAAQAAPTPDGGLFPRLKGRGAAQATVPVEIRLHARAAAVLDDLVEQTGADGGYGPPTAGLVVSWQYAPVRNATAADWVTLVAQAPFGTVLLVEWVSAERLIAVRDPTPTDGPGWPPPPAAPRRGRHHRRGTTSRPGP
jgi:hypothetical protein